MIYGIFHGGHNYSVNWTEEDIEEFNSIKQAKQVFESRIDFDPYYPCTDESAEMWLFYSKPVLETGDIYPDKQLIVGKRGGIRVI